MLYAGNTAVVSDEEIARTQPARDEVARLEKQVAEWKKHSTELPKKIAELEKQLKEQAVKSRNRRIEAIHPLLLDDLTVRFVENGWSLKWLHRKTMLSASFNRNSEEQQSVDPDNRLLTHFNRCRIDAEALCDSVLSVSGRAAAAPRNASASLESDDTDASSRRA